MPATMTFTNKLENRFTFDICASIRHNFTDIQHTSVTGNISFKLDKQKAIDALKAEKGSGADET